MKIYFDMDGVLANFEKGLRDLCGIEPVEQGKSNSKLDDVIWDAVCNIDHFYDKLEPIPGSFDLFYSLYKKYGNDCQILSAVPKPERNIPTAGDDKRRWVKRLLSPEVTVNIVLRKEKLDFCTGPDCVLIDDYDKNIAEWTLQGGIGILFTSVESAEKQLHFSLLDTH